ncbi:MAG: ankyrin repeat domain-containing protein, partial [Gemmataceae bacterium]
KLTSLDFVRRLVALGAKVDLPTTKGVPGRGVLNRPGATPLLAAASTADVPLMEALVKLGADPSRPNAQRTTPLLAAAGVGVGAPEEAAAQEPDVLEAVKLLVKLGADVNAVDGSGETALHGAAYRNHPKVVRLLADMGAKVAVWNSKNRTGLTPVVIAEGHRPGLNFRPSPETVAALHRVMLAAGVTPPEPTPAPAPKAGY